MAAKGTMEYYRNMDVAALAAEKAQELAAIKEARNHLGKPGDEGYKKREAHIRMLTGRTVMITQVMHEKNHKAHK